MNSFSKILYLPSGGLSYSPFVFVNPITLGVNFLEIDPFTAHSNFEHILSIMDQYVEFKEPLINIYTQDIYYIWLHYLNTDFQSEFSDFRKVHIPCKKCFEKNKVLIDYADTDVYINDRFRETQLKETHNIKINDIELLVTYRKVKHNIEFANLILANTEETDILLRIIYYILSQTDSIRIAGEDIGIEYWFDILASFNMLAIMKIYQTLLNIEMDFGAYNKITFVCYSCQSQQQTILFNNFYLSQMTASINKNILIEQENTFDYFLNFSRLPILSFEEICDMPVRFSKSMMQAVSKIKFHGGVVL